MENLFTLMEFIHIVHIRNIISEIGGVHSVCRWISKVINGSFISMEMEILHIYTVKISNIT